MNKERLYYIEHCKETIRYLYTEYETLLTRQKREPNPHKKAQLAREISMIKSEITANYDDIRIMEKLIKESEVAIGEKA